MSKRKHRSETSMLELVTQWQSSGISQNIFCKQEGLPYSVFQYWLKKFRKSSGAATSEFIEMKVLEAATQTATNSEIEVIFPSGTKIIFKACPDVSFIRSLVI
jgi:hypothetical protein